LVHLQLEAAVQRELVLDIAFFGIEIDILKGMARGLIESVIFLQAAVKAALSS
jgi:hypothetical protein